MKSTLFRIRHSWLLAATGLVALGITYAHSVLGQTWNGGGGNWGTPSNWTPPIVPNSSAAVSNFNAVAGSSSLVNLSGGPFTIGTLNLNNKVNGGFTFTGGTLQLEAINVQSHSPAPDLDASARIVLVAGTPFIRTAFPDSTLTIAGSLSDSEVSSFVTVAGPGTVTLTGTGSSSIFNDTFSLGSLLLSPDISAGTMIIQRGAKLSDSFGEVLDGTLTVTGAGSTWTNNGDLDIGIVSLGFGFRAGTLRIQDGGRVSDVNGIISDGAVIVAGAGSTWINSETLSIGVPVDLSILQITSGGTVSAAATTIFTLGTLEIGGSFTLNGPLTLNGGTVRAIADTTLPNDARVDTGGAILDSNGFNLTVSGDLSGPGGITKVSPGTVILTGTNTYSGGTAIEAGTLVAGTPSAAQEVSQALGKGDVFLMGGTLRTPSLDPLIINVGHNYTQAPGGTLALGVAGVNGRDYDQVQVGGNASLDGTLTVSSLSNFRPGRGNAFEVLRSNGTRSGQFAQVKDFLNNNPSLQRIDVYASNGVALLYVAAPHPGPSLGPIPSPIEAVIPTPLPPVDSEKALSLSFLLRVLNPTAEQLSSLFEIPFSEANTQRFNLNNRFAEIQRGSTGFASPLPPIPATGEETVLQKDGKTVSQPPVFQTGPQNRWGVWVNGWGDFVSVDDDNFSRGYHFTTGGGSVGIDYRITGSLAVGIFGSYAHTWTDLNPGEVDVNTGRGGLYATYWNKGLYVNGAVYGGYNSYDTSRRQLSRGLVSGSTSGYEFSTFLEAGYDFHFGNFFSVGPVASLQYTNVLVDAYSERGSFLPLNIHDDSEDSLRTDVGIQASYAWQIGKVLMIPTVRAAWEHEYLYSALPITFGAVDFPGVTATAFGPDEGHDSFIINAGVGTQWTPTISTFIGYQGQLGRSNYEANGVTGSISFSF
jgi:fibronectin-binding autotransporter adhesin